MSHNIKEAFNDCFERLSAGESLDSCLSDYPQYAVELDLMLRTSYDVKRRAYPIQPRPEFKYWARVRLQGVQDYAVRHPVQEKPVAFNLRRTLAVSMAALLVFVIASSGTVAASSESLPDEPLYGVKIAVEQARVTLAFSDVDKAEVYAHMAEKRAGEIVAMAGKGKADKMVTTTARMNYQLEQAELFIAKYEEANTGAEAGSSATVGVLPAESTAPAPTVMAIPFDKTASASGERFSQQDNFTSPAKPALMATRAAININRARNTMNTSTANSLAALQNALEKAPDSAKPALLEVIQHTRIANERAREHLNPDNNQHFLPPGLRPNTVPTVPPDKPPYLPPHNNNLRPAEPRSFNRPDLKNVLPQGGVDNHTDTADDGDEATNENQTKIVEDSGDAYKFKQTQPITDLRLPSTVNPIVK